MFKYFIFHFYCYSFSIKSGFYVNKNIYKQETIKNKHDKNNHKLNNSYLIYLIDNINFHIGQSFKNNNNTEIIKRFLIERKAFEFIKRITKIDNYQLNRLGLKVWHQKPAFIGLKSPKGISFKLFLLYKFEFN